MSVHADSLDPREGERIGGYYVRHLDTLYYWYTEPVIGADAVTVTVPHADLVGSVSKDAQHVYYRNHIVTGADRDTFEFLPACVAEPNEGAQDWNVAEHAVFHDRIQCNLYERGS